MYYVLHHHRELQYMHNTFIELDIHTGEQWYFNPRTCKLFHTKEDITEEDGKYTIPENRNRPLLIKHSQPSVIKFYLGSACNYRCSYCRQWEHSKLEHLTDDEIDQAVSRITNLVNKHTHPSQVTVQWWGGEPLLYIEDIKKIYNKLPKGTKQQFTSNGSLLTDDIVNWMIANHSSFVLSHDGPGQHLRGTDPYKNEMFCQLVNRLNDNKTDRFQFMISTILTENNYDICEIYKYHQSKFSNPIIMTKIEMVIPYHDKANVSSTALSHDINITEKLYRSFIQLDKEDLLMNIKSMDEDLREFLSYHTDVDYCIDMCDIKCGTASEQSVCMDRHGSIYPCQVYGDTDIIIGKFTDTSYTFTNTNLPRTMWNTVGCNCKDCPVVSLCRGVCPWLEDKFVKTNCINKYTVYTAIFKYIFYKIGYEISDMRQIEL